MPQISKTEVTKIQKKANDLRKLIIEMLVEAQSGHPASALGLADIFAVLYFNILNIDPKNPNAKNRDRLVLSNGHACPILYASLSEKGFFPKTKLWTLRQLYSDLEGHPVYGKLPGVENTSGSIAQGLSQAIGMAIAGKLDKLDFHVFCISGDGGLQEGQTWEAAMLAPNKKLDNITWIIDQNNIQLSGDTQDIMPLGNIRLKLESFGWLVLEIDGHNIYEIVGALEMAKTIKGRPAAIITHTIPGKGVKFMEYQFKWHGKPPTKEEAHKALKELSK